MEKFGTSQKNHSAVHEKIDHKSNTMKLLQSFWDNSVRKQNPAVLEPI